MNNNQKATNSKAKFFMQQSEKAPKIEKLNIPNYQEQADIEYFTRKLHRALNHCPENCIMCQKEQLIQEQRVLVLRMVDYRHHLTEFLAETGITPNIELLTQLWNDREEETKRIIASSKK